MARFPWISVIGVGVLSAATARAVEFSVWAQNEDIGFAPASIAYNPVSGKLLLAGTELVEWEAGAGEGTVLVQADDWGGSPFACAYIPARGTYLVTDRINADLIEVVPETPGQIPTPFVDVDAINPNLWPAGGMVQDGTYGYYKNQWTGVQQTVNRFSLADGTESEYVPKAAFDAWSSSGPSQQLAMDATGTLHLSARNSVIKPNRGIYRWDPDAAALVPVIQEPAIKEHTGEDDAIIYGMTFDSLGNLFFYEIYSSSVLKLDRRGTLTTFFTSDDVRAFMGDPEMAVHVSFMATVSNRLIFITGNVSGHVLTADIATEPEMVTIPGTDYEPGGPTYTYEIGKYEVTNAQYRTFLNNAQEVRESDPDDPRCSHMWFDPANGDVYMEDVTPYPPGPERYDRTLYKTSDLDSKIGYDPALAIGSRFQVQEGFHDHPVGTVSWFGAAKYCNWLTIDAGLGASECCYHEGTTKHDWYPITASDWAGQGLLDSERLALVRDYRGYRLPADGVNVDHGGPGVATSWNMDANPYNEWYKAAAFDPDAPDDVRPGPGDDEEVQPDHWVFGFGADTITAADANLGDHGYPWPFHETTPVGFYNGIHTLFDGTPTVDTRNRYGLYDMCGNVAEWINDTALEYPWDSTYRGTRGGRWSTSDAKYTTNSVRTITVARYYAENNLGFRLARSFGYGDFNGDSLVDVHDYVFFAEAITGPDTAVEPGAGYEACDADGDNHVDLDDFARLQRLMSGSD